MYGKELIIDLYQCDVRRFTRNEITYFYEQLCKEIDMEPCKQTFWDDKWTWLWKILLFWQKIDYATDFHTKGTSAVQFILTSNITIHTLDKLGEVYINLFSCKDFDIDRALEFCVSFFDSKDNAYYIVNRGKKSFYQRKEIK